MTLNISCQSLLVCKVSFEESADSLMGTPLEVTNCFSLAGFKILTLPLTFGILIMCLGVGLFVSLFWGTLSASWIEYLFHEIREDFLHYFFRRISNFLLFLFSFCHPYDANVETLEVVQWLLILSSFFWILFFFLF